ncbi:DNA binding domain protein, excisionase family [Hyphomicrobium denitrificans ATCC 51888]|uniref:DNA binding domain protein, excisionase family n=1 Tax=Hyphomicrobium denitrificans (strain ATCC 51888 / DSM 1869 / NCIMB 11706 / TK 0415) TaxID=582899 RepID=D8JYU1_HYPDA|nr:DNA binding domain protein, excisionase family [Hyphomicrobium denitrificans ATCC 51888]
MKPLKRRPAGRQRAATPCAAAPKSTPLETAVRFETMATNSPVRRAAFTIDETVVMTGVGRDLIYEAIKSGRLVARKLGRRTIIPADALEKFIAHLPLVGAG